MNELELSFVVVQGYRQDDGTLRLGEPTFGRQIDDWPNEISINGSILEFNHKMVQWTGKNKEKYEQGYYI